MSKSNEILYIVMVTYKVDIVKPVLRGHIWDKEKWPYRTDDLLKRGSIHMKCSDRTRKR